MSGMATDWPSSLFTVPELATETAARFAETYQEIVWLSLTSAIGSVTVRVTV